MLYCVCVCVYTPAHPWYFPPHHSRAWQQKAKVLDLQSSYSDAVCSWQLEEDGQKRLHRLFEILCLFGFFLSSVTTVLKFVLRWCRSITRWTPLFPPNWHKAAASLCQSNKLMLSGIDCLLLIGPNRLMLAGEINNLNKQRGAFKSESCSVRQSVALPACAS